MKKGLIMIALISLACIGAVSVRYERSRVLSVPPAPLVLLDSARIFDIKAVDSFKITPEAMAEAYKEYCEVEYKCHTIDSACTSLPVLLRAIRICPMSVFYWNYNNSMNICGTSPRGAEGQAHTMAQHLKGKIPGATYIAAAKCALANRDTATVVGLLKVCMDEDSSAFRRVDAEEAFRPLENYPDYYRMMDWFIRADQNLGQRSSLRTMRFTHPSPLPYELTVADVWPKLNMHQDTSYTYVPTPAVDHAIEDLIRGNRFGRYSRHVDAYYDYRATIDVSPDFFSYIYRTTDDVESVKFEEIVKDGETEEAFRQRQKEEEVTRKLNVSEEYCIATIDKYGKVIAKQKIAGRSSPLSITTARITEVGNIEVTELAQKWARDPLVSGYRNNEVAGRAVTAVRHYMVRPDGHIVETGTTATAKAR